MNHAEPKALTLGEIQISRRTAAARPMIRSHAVAASAGQNAPRRRGRAGRGSAIAVGAALIALWAAPKTLAADSVYWANFGSNTISFAKLDGSGGGQLNAAGAILDHPTGVAIDAAAGRIYWANPGGRPPGPGAPAAASGSYTIPFANLDGSGGGGQLNTSGAALSLPRGVAINPAARKIYWANFANNTISFAKLDGSGGGQLNTSGAALSGPMGLAIDRAANRIYWTNQTNQTISFASLDGTGHGGQLDTSGATLNGPTGLAINRAANRIYWANQYNDTISFAKLDGTGHGGQLDTSGAMLSHPVGVALDRAGNRIYWANVLGNTISFARLDGSGGGGQLTTPGATLSNPNFPVLLKTPCRARGIGFGRFTHRRRAGTMLLRMRLRAAGRLVLSGPGVKRATKRIGDRGTLRFLVRPRGMLRRELEERGVARTAISVASLPSGCTKSKQLRLSLLMR